MYQDCLKLGKTLFFLNYKFHKAQFQNFTLLTIIFKIYNFFLDRYLKSHTIINLVLEKVIPFPANHHYLTIEAKLMSEFGLGHTFFDIIKGESGGKQMIWVSLNQY